MKNKIIRILSVVLSIIMMVSVMAVITFAEEEQAPYFSTGYEENGGKLLRSAVMFDESVDNLAKGTVVERTWKGITYKFIVGTSICASLEAARRATALNNVEIAQILLPAGDYATIDVASSYELFGENWDINPNKIGPDRTVDWAENEAWGGTGSNQYGETIVTDIMVLGTVTEYFACYGITLRGHFNDKARPISAEKTIIKIENMMLNQTSSITSMDGNYTFLFNNPNATDATAAVTFNSDETHIINLRIKKMANAGASRRLIQEKISPIVVIDGLYFGSDSGLNSNPLQWVKFADFFEYANYTIKNSYFGNLTAGGNIFAFEGCNKAVVGAKNPNQYIEINLLNNVVYNYGSSTAYFVNFYPSALSKINVNGNYLIQANGVASMLWQSSNITASDNYTGRVFARYNTLIGSGGGINIATSSVSTQTIIDVTGHYQATTYDPNFRTAVAGIKPTGNSVSYDYYYLDYARTKKSNAMPEIEFVSSSGVTGAINDEEKTMLLNIPTGTTTLVPSTFIKGASPSYPATLAFYASDSEFSNIDTYESETALGSALPIENLNQYYIAVVKSFDGLVGYPYKMTVNKAAPNSVTPTFNVSTPGATSSTDGLVTTVLIPNTGSELKFIIPSKTGVTYTVYEGVTPVTSGIGNLYTLTVDSTILQKYTVVAASASETETFTLYVAKMKNKDANLIDLVGEGITGTTLLGFEADIAYGDGSYTITTTISSGATMFAKKGSTAFIRNEDTGIIKIFDIAPGVNVYNLGITSEDDSTYKEYTLTINRALNHETELISISGADRDDAAFFVTTRGSFKVNATVSDGATYKIYSDAALTKEVTDNLVVIGDQTRTVYIVVTAQNGTNVSAPYVLVVKRDPSGIVIKNAVASETVIGTYTISAAKDLTSYDIEITATNATYSLYADRDYSVSFSDKKIAINQSYTNVFIQVNYEDGSIERLVLTIYSPRSTSTYTAMFKDAASVPSWAATSLAKLTSSSYNGILVGDDKGNFNPGKSLNRYEIAVIAVKLLAVDATKFSAVPLTFADSIATWAQPYVKVVLERGIMTGNLRDGKNYFDGLKAAQRQQFALIIVNVSFMANGISSTLDQYYETNKSLVDTKYNAMNFADEDTVQTWAKTAIRLAVFAEILSGSSKDGKNYIKGSSDIKRQEVAVMLCQFYGL